MKTLVFFDINTSMLEEFFFRSFVWSIFIKEPLFLQVY